MPQPTVVIQSLKANAPLTTATELSLAVTIACPPQPTGEAKPRSRLNLAIAIDQSGSMNGKALSEAKLCASRVVEALQVGDRIAVISFDNVARVIVSAIDVTSDKADILRAILQVEARGNTDVHGGWLAAATEAASGLSADVLTRVMLLSDGNTNSGVRDVAEICRQVAALAEKGIATTTIGLGTNFDEDLMTQIATSGQGMATYGETADDLWPSFESEFGLLSATCGKNVRLRMTSPCNGGVSVENGFPLKTPGVWILPNIAYGTDMTALVKVAVSGMIGAEAQVLEVSLDYDTMSGDAAQPVAATLRLPLVDFANFVIGASHPMVAERMKENEAANLQLDAKAAARHHNFAAVGQIADKLFAMAGDSTWIAGMAQTMRGLAETGDAKMLSKEASYASAQLRSSYKKSSLNLREETPEFLKLRTSQGKASYR